ncbi:MAG: sigma-70 family RNA polymerase sigma factor [Anaerolineae bacterium]|nr:sigma-70 family RNA polymerase sigma factor [Anaerolineae bacterium]
MTDVEHDLLQRARQLDEQALAAIFDTYYPAIHRFIFHQVGHTETAEDLAGEVFRRLLEQLGKGRGPKEYLQAWLYQVARNLVVDDARKQQHRRHEEIDETLAANGTAVEETAHQSLLAAETREALDQLTEKQRTVIVLKYLEGKENAEIAGIMSIPVGAVKSLQHRGLAAIRRVLSESAGRSFEGNAV